MRQKKLAILLLVVTLVFALLIATACNLSPSSHTHTYSDRWTYDETTHWHAATCEHADEVSDKAVHDFVDSQCSVCGYIKFISPKVDEEAFVSALQLRGLTNWTVTVIEGDDEYVAFARDGNLTFTGWEHDDTIFEIPTDGPVIIYRKWNNGVWEEWDYSGNVYVTQIIDSLEGLLSSFTNLSLLWDEFELVDCKYVASGLEYEWGTDWGAGYLFVSFSNATVEMEFGNGEIVSIKIAEMQDGEEIYAVILDKIGSTSIEKPNATKHEHTWTYIPNEDEHEAECSLCYENKSEQHDYDDDGICTVCGAMNHKHIYNVYIPYRYM